MSNDFTIRTTRVVDAPRERVFRAWTDPAILAKWWGPKGFRNTFHTFDLRPGGHWDFHMHGPDGTDYHNTSVFVEVVPNERLVFDHLGPMHWYRATMIFTEQEGGTSIDWRMTFPAADIDEQVKAFIPHANEENLDRLEHELRTGPITGPSTPLIP